MDLNGRIIHVYGVRTGTWSRNGGFFALPGLITRGYRQKTGLRVVPAVNSSGDQLSRFCQVQFRNALQQQSALQRFGIFGLLLNRLVQKKGHTANWLLGRACEP